MHCFILIMIYDANFAGAGTNGLLNPKFQVLTVSYLCVIPKYLLAMLEVVSQVWITFSLRMIPSIGSEQIRFRFYHYKALSFL